MAYGSADADKPAADDKVRLWRAEIQRAKKVQEKWYPEARKIIERYRLEKQTAESQTPRYNILWSNIQTLAPAVYARPPKSVVQRRYLDRDPIGRIACRILQRSVQYQIDAGDLHEAVKQCVFDRLAVGRGVAWVRYEPVFEQKPMPEDVGSEQEDGNPDGEAQQQVAERISWEMCRVDYVHWQDFLHSPARTWSEVDWVAKKAYMTRQELVDRFGEEKGNAIPLTYGPDQEEGSRDNKHDDQSTKACIWETWDKPSRKVCWIADDFDQVCDEQDDPLKLADFFPCPRPLFGAMTNDTLVPVPDYEQYRPQARQMDEITARIDRLVEACKVRGVYDSSIPELVRLFRGSENDLIPVEAWQNFATNGGMKGAVDFAPIEVFAKVIETLMKAKADTKAEIYEITGISDIMRGQGDADETATGVKTKGRFATLRLQDEQAEVARFVRDIVRIIAEITAELFQPETLAQMASAEEMDDLQIDAPMPPPMMGHNGGPPMGAM